MAATAIMQDIRDFGILCCPEYPTYARRMAHALIHDFFTHYRRSGQNDLDTHEALLGYVSVVMESVEGFNELSEERRNDLLEAGITYLTRVMDETERFLGDITSIAIPYQQDERNNLLMVV